MGTLLCPKYAFLIEIYPRDKDTSLYRTPHQVPKVPALKWFQHSLPPSLSYQQKILGLLAEKLLKNIQQSQPDPPNVPRPQPSQPQTTEADIPAPLPDVVTSSILSSQPGAADRQAKKHRIKHASRALHRLMKCDIALLEAESRLEVM